MPTPHIVKLEVTVYIDDELAVRDEAFRQVRQEIAPDQPVADALIEEMTSTAAKSIPYLLTTSLRNGAGPGYTIEQVIIPPL